MQLLFLDDSKQRTPYFDGIGPLTSVGGFIISNAECDNLRDFLSELAKKSGFPEGEEFKWSPRKKDWMYSNLVGEDRFIFFKKVFIAAKLFRSTAFVVIEDANPKFLRACGQMDGFRDGTALLLERAQMHVGKDDVKIFMDKPGGGRTEKSELIIDIKTMLTNGTRYNKLINFDKNIELIDSKTDNLLQLSDLIVSCVTAYVAGERRFSPPLMRFLLPLLKSRQLPRIRLNEHPKIFGGCGIKIHPSKYRNLYHWLFGDNLYKDGDNYIELPDPRCLFYAPPVSRQKIITEIA